jgi:maltose O-acetyltransferase
MKQLLNKIFKPKYSNTRKLSLIEKYKNIGKNVNLKGENVLDNVNPHLVYIGDNCVIGHRSSILTHCPIRGGIAAKLGDYVWLGFGVIVLPGAVLGNNTIVGGGSVVTKSFPDNVIIAGNPARVIRELTNEEIQSLQHRLKNNLPMGKKNID